MGQIVSQPLRLLDYTATYYRGLWYYTCGQGRHGAYDKEQLPPFLDRLRRNATAAEAVVVQHVRIHLFNLAANFYLYNKPHYRKGSYREDLLDNLRNVAIPGTGVPLSWLVGTKLQCLWTLTVVYPIVSWVASLHQWIKNKGSTSLADEYRTRLLAPNDWFNYWRLNCVLVGLHALLHDRPVDYDMENKWTFLEEGVKRGVPVSPYLSIPAVVIKHRNEEGGLGIHFYKNATHGGDWIIQERIDNSAWVNSLLPSNAPLSTFRVITCSRSSMSTKGRHPQRSDVKALSCVFRAGREGAATDHDSILFDVDMSSGRITGGTTNAHWYRLGPTEVLPGRCPWRSSHSYQTHPDGNIPVAGATVPEMEEVLRLAEDSHWKMCPRVPMAGWDVVLSSNPKLPRCLLEVNLSCNFFRGSFDKKVWYLVGSRLRPCSLFTNHIVRCQQMYLDFIDEGFSDLQAMRITGNCEAK